jgi:hypothetical protein
MFDSESLNPIIGALITYLALVVLVPKIIKEPTGIKVVDDVVLLLIAQKGSLMSGTILIAIVVFLSKYVQGYLGGGESS